MSDEKAKKKGHSVALSGVIGFALVALLVGMALGGYLGLFVIAPNMHQNQQDSENQGNQGNTGNENNNQNGNGNQGVVKNNNPSPSNPTSTYGGNRQFDLAILKNGNSVSGAITTNINCAVQQNGNNIQLALTFTLTTVSQSLQQAINNGEDMTFNFAGTTSGSQINANTQGTVGSDDKSVTFDLNLSGSIEQYSLTLTVSSASDSQISLTTPQPIVLHSNN